MWIPAVAAALMAASFAPAQDGAEGLSASIEVPRRDAFAGERFPVVLSVATRGVRLGQDMSLMNLPPAEAVVLSPFEELAPLRAVDGATLVETRRFQALALAKRPGPVAFAPVLQVRVIVQQRAFLGSTWVETVRNVQVRPASVNVRNLPEAGRPPDYSGAIGAFEFRVSVAPTNIAPGDLVRAEIAIAGYGNLDNVKLPAFSPGRSFKAYEPRVVSGPEPGGELRIQQVIVPLTTNAVALPEITFSYFDPETGAYRTRRSGPFGLNFRPPDKISFESFRPQGTAGTAEQPAAPSEGPRRGGVRPGTAIFLSYWAAAIAVALALGGRTRRRMVAAAVFLLVAGAAFLPVRRAVHARVGGPPVEVAGDIPARLAPGPGAAETFRISAGAGVRILDEHKGWLKVRLGDDSGWIPAAAVRNQ
jgi:hypothetical protein